MRNSQISIGSEKHLIRIFKKKKKVEENILTPSSSQTLDTKPNVGYFIKLQPRVIKAFPAEAFLLIAPPV